MDRVTFSELFQNKQFKTLREELLDMEYADIAQLLEELSAEESVMGFRLLPKDVAVEVFDHLGGQQQLLLLGAFNDTTARSLLEMMPPDDRAELLEEVPAIVARRLLQLLSPEERRVTLTLLGYEEDTAGRLMTPHFIDLRSDMTIHQALVRIRTLSVGKETIYVSYVIDAQRRLLGTVSLKDIVLADPDSRVKEIMVPDPKVVYTGTDQEEAARVLRDNELLAVPVVDIENRLVGIVTWDDVVDVVEEEATEDIYKFGAVSGTERGYFTSRILSVVRRRAVWLLLLILVNTVTGSIIAGQEELLGEIVILAAFIPLLIGTGGNVGAQSATVIIRGLATGEVNPQKALFTILREAAIGAVLGLILGAIVLGWAYVLGRDLMVSLVVSLTLLAISILATLSGGALPFVFRLVKLDPALVSAPFITTIMDIFGVGLYFFVAHLLLQF